MRLTNAQVEQFNREGYLFFPTLFSPEEVAILEATISDVAQADAPGVKREESSHTVRMIHGPHLIHETIGRLACHPRLIGPAQQLLGSPVYLFQSRLVLKQGLENRPFEGFPWHQDFSTWYLLDGMPEPRAVVIGIFLDEMTACNAPVLIVPQSHRWGLISDGRPLPKVEHYTQVVISREVLQDLVKEGGLVPLLGSPGAAFFINCNLVHGSSENISPWRRAIQYMIFNSVENRCLRMTRQEHHAARDLTPITPLSDDCLLR
jgi:L-proline 4-hydroxylase